MLHYRVSYDDLRTIAYREVLIVYGTSERLICGRLIPPSRGTLKPYFRIELAKSAKVWKFRSDSEKLSEFYVLISIQEYLRSVKSMGNND